MNLCDACLTPLTADDIGNECTSCWETWAKHQADKDIEWWGEAE